MAVTTAQFGRHSRCVAFKQGTSGQPAGKQIRRQTSVPICSFDGYHYLIGPDHVESSSCGRFDHARVGAQSLNFDPQGLVPVAKGLDISLHARIFLRRQGHPGCHPHCDRDTNCKSPENYHSKNHPRRYYSTAFANFSGSSDDVQRHLSDGCKRGTLSGHDTLRPNSLINPIRIYDPAQEAPPSPLLILIPRRCGPLVLSRKAASTTTNRPRK
jgi:hypothetical protein